MLLQQKPVNPRNDVETPFPVNAFTQELIATIPFLSDVQSLITEKGGRMGRVGGLGEGFSGIVYFVYYFNVIYQCNSSVQWRNPGWYMNLRHGIVKR